MNNSASNIKFSKVSLESYSAILRVESHRVTLGQLMHMYLLWHYEMQIKDFKYKWLLQFMILFMHDLWHDVVRIRCLITLITSKHCWVVTVQCSLFWPINVYDSHIRCTLLLVLQSLTMTNHCIVDPMLILGKIVGILTYYATHQKFPTMH